MGVERASAREIGLSYVTLIPAAHARQAHMVPRLRRARTTPKGTRRTSVTETVAAASITFDPGSRGTKNLRRSRGGSVKGRRAIPSLAWLSRRYWQKGKRSGAARPAPSREAQAG